MQIGIVITVDTKTGDYEMKFNNVSHPGEPMDYWMITEALRRVLNDFTNQVDNMGPDSNDSIKKDVH